MSGEQMTLEAAFEARDQAVEHVEARAEERNPGFRDAASGFILRYLALHGEVSGEDCTNACKRASIAPHDDRAFGPVYLRMVRSEQIEKVGACPRKKGHGTGGGNIWKLKTT